jgi:hypothetical protein
MAANVYSACRLPAGQSLALGDFYVQTNSGVVYAVLQMMIGKCVAEQLLICYMFMSVVVLQLVQVVRYFACVQLSFKNI